MNKENNDNKELKRVYDVVFYDKTMRKYSLKFKLTVKNGLILCYNTKNILNKKNKGAYKDLISLIKQLVFLMDIQNNKHLFKTTEVYNLHLHLRTKGAL